MNTLTIAETAKILKLSTRTVSEYLRDGKLPGRKIGGRWRILEDDLRLYLRGEQRAE